jgi:hypothetical protein
MLRGMANLNQRNVQVLTHEGIQTRLQGLTDVFRSFHRSALSSIQPSSFLFPNPFSFIPIHTISTHELMIDWLGFPKEWIFKSIFRRAGIVHVWYRSSAEYDETFVFETSSFMAKVC